MYYSVIGILALLILVILNYDVILKKNKYQEPSVQSSYRLFLFSIMAYYITDILWGVFDYLKLAKALYIDTLFYFIAMAIGVLLWTRYAVAYLNRKNIFSRLLSYSGIAFFAVVTVLTVANIFAPVMFYVDEESIYHPCTSRYIILIIQIIVLFLTFAYALFVFFVTKGKTRKRHLTISLFGLIMLIFIFIQIFNPYLPLYAMGYFVGSCLLHSFVIGDEKAAYRKELETSLKREAKQLSELTVAWSAAYTDAMTGAKSKLAFLQKSDELDKGIDTGEIKEMAIALFDMNGLKIINDTYGHETGDEYIKEAFKTICGHFDHSPVYRTGGDEFVAILQGRDYDDRYNILKRFNKEMEENQKKGKVVVSVGIADYTPGVDNSCKRIFDRADHNMYKRKDELKNMRY